MVPVQGEPNDSLASRKVVDITPAVFSTVTRTTMTASRLGMNLQCQHLTNAGQFRYSTQRSNH